MTTVASRSCEGTVLRLGDDLNARADWPEILQPHGWSIDKELSNGEVRWNRPGKTIDHGATTGHNKGLHVFTDSDDAAPFQKGGNYSKFEAYALLNHGGDHKEAAKALGRQGYGRPHPCREATSDGKASGRWKLPKNPKRSTHNGKVNGRRIIGASRKSLFRTLFRFPRTCLAYPPDETWGGPCRAAKLTRLTRAVTVAGTTGMRQSADNWPTG